ncbi:MAG: hypothetical protein JGK17_20710 [Microcoleus sp. PH2017_10_PVI_O_A]|uniref:hypothetical protein n=1 Tax=unclassified Microcoleus TaxID=2642155 RepID=UPI001DD4FBF6|nr:MULTISPECIES: hypothetical protein [unclassified Microcoleus]MCC3407966.1 hypothetical protein [Microcoleus sp. PH2017_10_PVI_O_A]MCC3462137.1 hypothetical protein [Microcoleus sp. PH2017_11_PCY_U_A]MCC3480570.1 hypothetical protein [Microcoleus sp. PH2017_12_PCY_D_A]MCC3529949.1 hypothetical protein [Microcoleus sp. PH2017_21_RUC_O_A]MCC3542243.1 hypothetical protein [Microcoleus sp. PH2017_22_RUC_O_B]
MNSTKKQQVDRKSQAFAGHFRIKTGMMQSLQMPAFSRSFVQQTPDFVQQMPDFSAPQQLAIF